MAVRTQSEQVDSVVFALNFLGVGIFLLSLFLNLIENSLCIQIPSAVKYFAPLISFFIMGRFYYMGEEMRRLERDIDYYKNKKDKTNYSE